MFVRLLQYLEGVAKRIESLSCDLEKLQRISTVLWCNCTLGKFKRHYPFYKLSCNGTLKFMLLLM